MQRLLGLVLVSLCASFAGAQPTEDDIAGKPLQLYGLIRAELDAVLRSEERWRELPNNLTHIDFAPDGTPYFTLNAGAIPVDSIARRLVDQRGTPYRLLLGGRVCGWGGDGRLAIARAEGRHVALVTDDVPTSTASRRVGASQQAFVHGDEWVFVSRGGVLRADGSSWLEPGALQRKNYFAVADDDGFVVFATAYSSRTKLHELATAHSRGAGGFLEVRDHGAVPLSKVEGAVRCADGRLLVIGERRIFSPGSGFGALDEEAMLGVVELLEQGKIAEFEELLPGLSLHGTMKMLGFRKLLSGVPVPSGSKLPKSGETVSRAISHINSGLQFFAGMWIHRCRVLEQRGLAEVLVAMSYVRPDSGKTHRGLFRIAASGEPQLLTALPDENILSLSLARGRSGTIYLLCPGVGVGRLSSRGELEWLDRSERARRMGKLDGVDASERLYFSYYGPASTAPKAMWIFDPSRTARPATPAVALAVTSEPVATASGAVWFTTDSLEFERLGGDATPMELADTAHSRTRVGEHSPIRSDTTRFLCRLEHDAAAGTWRATKVAASPCFHRTTITPGRNGSVLTVRRGCVHLIAGGKEYVAANLGALATERFAALSAAAPTESFPVIASLPPPALVSWLRWQDALWIGHGSFFEVYRDGKLLPVRKKLILRNAPFGRSSLVGPLVHDGVERVLVISAPPVIGGYYWLRRNDDDFDIESVAAPKRGPLRNAIDDWRAPVVGPSRGSVSIGFGRSTHTRFRSAEDYDITSDSGVPWLALGDDSVVVRRTDAAGRGFVRIAGEARQPLEGTFRRMVQPARLLADGGVVGFGRESIVWWDASLRLERTLPLELPAACERYLGHAAGKEILDLRKLIVLVDSVRP